MNTVDPDKEYMYISNDFCFNTLEGEGRYIGYPTVFIRLASCNLTCQGFKSVDSPFGCDSYVSWSIKNKMTFTEIAKYMEEREHHELLKNGALFKISGGEPFLQQKKLLNFIKFIRDRWGFVNYSKTLTSDDIGRPKLHIDFETNGTIMPDEEWSRLGIQVTYTTSPKLSSNGDPVEKRYKPEVLRYLAVQDACFKFVAKQESDLNEVLENYLNNPEVGVRSDQVWIMPMCGSRKELLEVGPIVAELCKKYNFKFSNRLHLQLWDKALSV